MQKVTSARKIVLARELTKIHEEFIYGTAGEILEHLTEPKGEFVIIIDKSEEIEENIFEKMSLEEHFKYYEDIRNG